MSSGAVAYDASPFVPEGAGVPELRAAARGCRGCPLYRDASQTVFGAGAERAPMMLLGEQPGDMEDRSGEPFVGPAGRLLREALDAAGVDRGLTYTTNAVKHFKFEPAVRGRRRIHKPPNLREISACRPWLAAELAAVDPRVVVALGASAGKAVHGPDFRVTRSRGEVLPMPDLGDGGGPARVFVATIHPSAVLRADDRQSMFDGLVADLRVAVGELD